MWTGPVVRAVLPPLLALLGYAAAAAFPSVLLGDADTYWHLAAADWMVSHRAVPLADPFSASMPGTPWVDHEWLSEILLWLAWQAAGWPGVAALGASAFALALGLLASALLRSMAPAGALAGVPIGAAALTVLAGVAAARDLYARPHLLVLPLLVLWATALLQARGARRPPPWRVLPVMLLWANMHGSFALGLLLVPPLALEAWLDGGPGRTRAALAWVAFCAAATAVALLNPNGATGLIHPFAMLRMPVLADFVEEWRSPDFHLLQPVELWLLAVLMLILLRGVRLPPIRAALLLALLHAALSSRRHALVLGFLGPLLLSAPLAASWWPQRAAPLAAALPPSRRSAAAAWGGACVLAAILSVPLLRAARPDAGITPDRAVAAVPDRVRAAPMLNEYDFGGYLIHAGLRPFVDGRADMYGEAFLQEYQRAMTPDLRRLGRLLRTYRIGWTLLRASDPAASLLDALPGWRRIHADDIAVVHARTELLDSP